MTPAELARFRTIVSQSSYDQLKRLDSKLDTAAQVLSATGLTDTQHGLGVVGEKY